MVILFSLWFILQWQFPSWLWILSGFFYVISLRPKKKIKKQISFRTQVLPFSLALAIIFGVDKIGNPILPASSSAWVVIGVFLGAIFVMVWVALIFVAGTQGMFARKLTDALNRTVNLPDRPQRIVWLGWKTNQYIR